MSEIIGNGLGQLAPALVKAQGQFHNVPKTGRNPHLGNSYATLDDIIAAVRGPLAANGLSFVQLIGNNDQGFMTLCTMLIHESGQTLASEVVINAMVESRGVNTMQAMGSSITYMKRYMLSAMLGIATGDDTDGEGAGDTSGKKQASKPKPAAATGEIPTNGKCVVCKASGDRHAPWCKEVEGQRVDTREAA